MQTRERETNIKTEIKFRQREVMRNVSGVTEQTDTQTIYLIALH